MPPVKIFVRKGAYAKLLKEADNDPSKIAAIISRLVHEKYE